MVVVAVSLAITLYWVTRFEGIIRKFSRWRMEVVAITLALTLYKVTRFEGIIRQFSRNYVNMTITGCGFDTDLRIGFLYILRAEIQERKQKYVMVLQQKVFVCSSD